MGRTARRTVCLILRLLITFCDSDDALCTTGESSASCRQCFGVVGALGEGAGQVGCSVGRRAQLEQRAWGHSVQGAVRVVVAVGGSRTGVPHKKNMPGRLGRVLSAPLYPGNTHGHPVIKTGFPHFSPHLTADLPAGRRAPCS